MNENWELEEIELEHAHRTMNHGNLVFISSRDEEASNQDAIMVAQWNMPIRKKNPSLLCIALGVSHHTTDHLRKTKKFIVSIPTADMKELVKKIGSTTGKKIDKINEYKFDYVRGKEIPAIVPQGVLASLECELHKEIPIEDNVYLVIGRIIKASVLKDTFKNNMYDVKNTKVRSIHHMGADAFITGVPI